MKIKTGVNAGHPTSTAGKVGQHGMLSRLVALSQVRGSKAQQTLVAIFCCLLALGIGGCGSSSSLKLAAITVGAATATTPASTTPQTTLISGGQLALSETVTSDPNFLGVDWSVACGSTGTGACGTLTPAHTASGAVTNYTAPLLVPTGGTVTITATSTNDPSKKTSVTLTINTTDIAVTLTPVIVALDAGAIQGFTATVVNDTAQAGVTFTVTCGSTAAGACGFFSNGSTIDPAVASGVAVTYQAPTTAPTGGSVTVTATSVSDPGKTAVDTFPISGAVGGVTGITVYVSPTAASLQPGGSTTITPTVANDAQLAGVTWTVTCGSPSCGSVSPTTTASGTATTYTAPLTAPAGAVTVTATSVTDPTQSASTSVSVTAAFTTAVSITGAPASLATAATASLTASVSGDSTGAGVAWSVTCGTSSSSACGSFNPVDTPSGIATVYTAPGSIPAGTSVTIVATSVANNAVSAMATIAITQGSLSVSISQAPTTLQVGLQAGLTALVANDSGAAGVNWAVTCASAGACGTINPTHTTSGIQTNYTAPSAAPTGGTVTITATSAADSTKTATATITITAVAGLNVVFNTAPPSTLEATATAMIAATVNNDPANAGVTWSATCSSTVAGACGTFNPATTASGPATTYTAPAVPPSPATVNITAASVTNPAQAASATITITAASSITVAINQTAPASLTSGATFGLSATTTNDTGTVTGVNWTVTCGSAGFCGVLSPSNTGSGVSTVYTAPAAVPIGTSVTVTATSAFDPTKSAALAIPIAPTAGLSIALTQGSTTVFAQGQDDVIAVVNGDPNGLGVDWTVSCPVATPACGSVGSFQNAHTDSGIDNFYLSPATLPTGGIVTVTATSTATPVVSASFDVTVLPDIALTINPGFPATLIPGASASISADTTNDTTNAGIDWTVSCVPSQAYCGTLTPAHTASGAGNPTTYAAPATVPAGGLTVSIEATATANPSLNAFTQTIVAVPAAVTITFANAPAPLAVGATESLAATVGSDPNNEGVDWSCTPASTCGSFNPAHTASGSSTVFTAPASIPTSGNVTVVAASTADSTKSVSATIAITASTPMGNALLNGHYAFVLTGSGTDATNFTGYQMMAGSFVADGAGNITSGEEDVASESSTSSVTATSQIALSGGSHYTITSDGRGTVTLNTTGASYLGNNGVQTFKIVIQSPEHALIEEFDGNLTSSGSATATGTLDLQDTSTFGTALNGQFSFTLLNTAVGELTADGGVMTIANGTITSIIEDGSATAGGGGAGTGTGSFISSLDAFGRGTASIPTSDSLTDASVAGFTQLLYYKIDAGHILLLNGDSSYPSAAAGSAWVTPSGANLTSFEGNFVFTTAGAALAGTGLTAGGTFNCTTTTGNTPGTLSGLFDTVNGTGSSTPGTLMTGQVITGGTCTLDTTGTGRVVLSFSGENNIGMTSLALYPTQDNGYLVLENDNVNGEQLGIAYPQASSLGASTFSGAYAAGFQFFDTGVAPGSNPQPNLLDITGLLTADGVGSLSGTVDVDPFSADGGTSVANRTVAGATFAAPADGRSTGPLTITGLSAESPALIYYFVDGSTVLAIRSDGNGGSGIFELQQF